MFKKWQWLNSVCLIVVMGGSLLTACNAPSSAPTSAPATKSAPTTVAPVPLKAATAPTAKTITLKFAGWTAPGISMSKCFDWYMSEVEKRSNGRVKIERYWSESLAPAAALLDAVNGGMADLAMMNPAYYPGKLPLASVGELVFYLTTNVWPARKSYSELYETIPALRDEAAKYKTKFISPIDGLGMGLIFRKEVKSLEDLKGLKLRATSSQAVMLKEMGATPVNIAAPDVYTALERGTIDGVVWNMPGVTAWGVQSVAKFYWKLPAGGNSNFLGMNLDTWNSLPPDIQQIMTDVAKDQPATDHRIMQIEGEDGVDLAKFKDAGGVVSYPSAAEVKRAQDIAKQVVFNKWIADQEAAGRPGKQVFDALVNSIQKYEPLSPFKK